MRLFYQLGYRYFRMPWDIGPRKELVELVQSGRIVPSRAIDLGSGTASNVIFLAQHGFEVTGVDFVQSAIELGQKRAKQAGAKVTFIRDDLTNLKNVTGAFDFLLDYGTLDDLLPKHRDLYVQNMLPLTHSGSQYLLYCFEWPLNWWEQWLLRLTFFGAMVLEPGEAERRFGPYFEVELITRETNLKGWTRGFAVYLMTRN